LKKENRQSGLIQLKERRLPQEETQLGSLKKILKLAETTLAHVGLVKNINSAMARTESFFPQGFL